MSARECTTQDEVDAAIEACDSIILRGSTSVILRGHARAALYDSASATLFGTARAALYDTASAIVCGPASADLHDSSSATLYDAASATLYDSASATLFGTASATLHHSARAFEGVSRRPLHQSRPVILIGPIGSRDAMLSVYQCEDGGQLIRAGCFLGTRDKFAAAVKVEHKEGRYADEYRAALVMIDALKGAT